MEPKMYFLSNQQEDHYFEANSRQFQTGRPVCTNLDKGLALWEDTVTYRDMKSIASSDVLDKPIWTALNNKNKKDCDGASACDGKLVI